MHKAALWGRPATVHWLAREAGLRGVDGVADPDDSGASPSRLARDMGHDACVAALEEYGW